MAFSSTDKAAFFAPLSLAALALLAGGAVCALLWFGGTDSGTVSALLNDAFVWRIVRFTLWQALLSTLISVALAIPVAFMFFENGDFWGRGFLLRIFALPLVLPQIVAVLAIVSLYGNQGYVTLGLKNAGIDLPTIYGLTGILIAHVFFNLPLVVRVILGALGSMPTEYHQLAHQLSMPGMARLRQIYWPYMRPALFNAAALVFMLCVTSFTVVLTLGGGPRATTLEVAIYQALTFDFDIGRAVVLTALQLMLTLAAVFAFARLGGDFQAGLTVHSGRSMVTRRSALSLISAASIIGLAGLFVVSPFIAITAKGFEAELLKLLGQSAVQNAILTSVFLGACAAVLSVAVSVALSEGAVRSHGRGRWIYSHAASLILVIPPIVIAAGWFILLRPFVNVYEAAPYLVIAVNAAMALPFAMRFVLTARQVASERHDRLCAQLGIRGFYKWRLILWPSMKKPLLIAFVFAFALSLGDLGVIALFGSEKVQTLPFLILQRMGSYRTDDAAGLAFILCCLTMALMLFVDRSDQQEKS